MNSSNVLASPQLPSENAHTKWARNQFVRRLQNRRFNVFCSQTLYDGKWNGATSAENCRDDALILQRPLRSRECTFWILLNVFFDFYFLCFKITSWPSWTHYMFVVSMLSFVVGFCVRTSEARCTYGHQSWPQRNVITRSNWYKLLNHDDHTYLGNASKECLITQMLLREFNLENPVMSEKTISQWNKKNKQTLASSELKTKNR